MKKKLLLIPMLAAGLGLLGACATHQEVADEKSNREPSAVKKTARYKEVDQAEYKKAMWEHQPFWDRKMLNNR